MSIITINKKTENVFNNGRGMVRIDTITPLPDEDMGDVYHRRYKVQFEKSPNFHKEFEEQFKSDMQNINLYINSSLPKPLSVNSNSIVPPMGYPRYNIETVRNEIENNQADKNLTVNLISYYSGFDTHNTIDPRPPANQAKTIVFKNEPETYASLLREELFIYNHLTMTNQTTGLLTKKLYDLNKNFNIYPRVNILLSDYSDILRNLSNGRELDFKMLVDNYSIPVDEDKYYLFGATLTPSVVDPLAPDILDMLSGLLSNDQNLPDLSQMIGNSIVPDSTQTLALGQIKKQLSTSGLSFEQILRGVDTPGEVLFYKVEKWFSSQPQGRPQQVFLIPAKPNSSNEFIDSQILQDRIYYYRVKMYYATVGYEYFFTDYYSVSEYATCNVNIRPKINIYQETIFEDSMYNIYFPPMPPSVSFYSKATTGELKIYLELDRGQQRTKPINILSTDDRNVPSNGIFDNGDILFKYRKQNATFQIFRTLKKPTTYGDFEGNEIGFFENTNEQPNMIIMDKIKPSTKYYYTFRTFNEFGSFSNPTTVYEVEMLKDADEVKVAVKAIPMSQSDPSDQTNTKMINFKSLMKLEVSHLQTQFDYSGVEVAGDIPTFKQKVEQVNLTTNLLNDQDTAEGPTPENSLYTAASNNNSIWGRKFKFRVRSNDSGKIIDFNIKVNLVTEKSEADFNV